MTANAIPTPVSAVGLLFITSGFRGNALKAVRLAGARPPPPRRVRCRPFAIPSSRNLLTPEGVQAPEEFFQAGEG